MTNDPTPITTPTQLLHGTVQRVADWLQLTGKYYIVIAPQSVARTGVNLFTEEGHFYVVRVGSMTALGTVLMPMFETKGKVPPMWRNPGAEFVVFADDTSAIVIPRGVLYAAASRADKVKALQHIKLSMSVIELAHLPGVRVFGVLQNIKVVSRPLQALPERLEWATTGQEADVEEDWT